MQKETGAAGLQVAGVGTVDSYEDQLVVVADVVVGKEAEFGVKRSALAVETVSDLVAGGSQRFEVPAAVVEERIPEEVLWCDHLKQFGNENVSAEGTIATQARLNLGLPLLNLASLQCWEVSGSVAALRNC